MSQDTVNLVDIHGVSFSYKNQLIFNDISLTLPRGKIIAVMGPSGIGKTTLLHLISGQILPDKGEILFNGENVITMSRSRLYTVRKKMSMLFQSGVLFNDMNVFDNVAYPLREHAKLPELLLKSIVMMKLETVGLRGAAKLKPSELSGGMAHRVALARATALEPDLIMFDEPFIGQDPVTMNTLVKLISKINNILGVTCIIVSHNIAEALSIANYAYILTNGKILAHGSTSDLKNNNDPKVKNFLAGIMENPMISCYPARDYRSDLLGKSSFKSTVLLRLQTLLLNMISTIKSYFNRIIKIFGRAGLMLFSTLIIKPKFNKYTPLLVDQIYNIGVLSTFIIVLSGLFIGMVLGLQSYFFLMTYGSETNLGMLISISLLRELGPVFSAIIFAGRVGSSLTSEILSMRLTKQLSNMEMMAVDPLHQIIAPRFWAGIISLPLLTIIFVTSGILGSSLVGIQWIGIDSGLFWSVMQDNIDFKIDLVNCIIKSIVFAVIAIWIALFNGYDEILLSEGINRITTRTVVHSILAVLILDFMLTVLMFGN